MKKFLLTLSIIVSCGIATAATVSWSATGWKNEANESYSISGTAYLLQYTGELSNDAVVDTITNHLTTEGLTSYTGDEYSLIHSSSIDNSTTTGSQSLQSSGIVDFSTSSYYVLIVLDGEKGFLLASSPHKFEQELPDGSNVSYTITFSSLRGSEWTSGILGGGEVDPNVPEPTALALLALGVAGVALRRRVA